VNTLGNLVALLMAVGATFGALNTMYSAVAARSREIATLRALGFQGGAVLVSVMAESLLLALVGGLLGGALAWAIADGYQTATNELAVLQPGRLQPHGDASAPRRRHRLRARDGVPRRASSPPSAPSGRRSSSGCGRSDA
jgi:hypothetical protein